MTSLEDDRCPEEEIFITRYAFGDCSDDERRQFAVHLKRCGGMCEDAAFNAEDCRGTGGLM